MREIQLSDGDNLSVLPMDTFLIYGDTGTGKTTASAGFPRPLFLADGSEGGWRSLFGLADDQLFEPEVNPMVWTIDQMNDMAEALKRIPPLVASGRIKTVVISSITFYANSYLAFLLKQDASRDTRQVYGELANHLRAIRTGFHALGTNVVWEALADHPESGEDGAPGKKGRPMIPGKAADQFSAGVSYLFRAALDDVRKDGKIVDRTLKLYTQTTGNYIARPRIGKTERQLPNPLLGGYKGYLQARGYDIEQLRRSLPPIQRASTPKPPSAKAPDQPAPKVVVQPPSGAKPTTK